MIIIYTRLYENDPYTVKGADFGEFYDRITKDMRKIILTELSTNGRIILEKLLDLLDTNNTELIGTQSYRRIIFKNQSKLAKILGVDRRYLSKGIADLEKHDIVKYNNGMLIVNPLVFNQNSIYDIRALQAFNIKQATDNYKIKSFTDNATLKRANESTRSKVGF